MPPSPDPEVVALLKVAVGTLATAVGTLSGAIVFLYLRHEKRMEALSERDAQRSDKVIEVLSRRRNGGGGGDR